MALKYDIHLSAFKIANETILKFEQLAFERDEFANNTRCELTEYHGTYRGKEPLPSTTLWNKLTTILNEDESFSGGLEEEEFDEETTIYFHGGKIEEKALLPSMITKQPDADTYKACDIHISINLDKSDYNCLKYLNTLEIASFDKPKNGVIYRIFTITCETKEDGQEAFTFLKRYYKEIKGLVGKMKIEKTVRFFRKPTNAYSLPLTDKTSFQIWIKKSKNLYVP